MFFRPPLKLKSSDEDIISATYKFSDHSSRSVACLHTSSDSPNLFAEILRNSPRNGKPSAMPFVSFSRPSHLSSTSTPFSQRMFANLFPTTSQLCRPYLAFDCHIRRKPKRPSSTLSFSAMLISYTMLHWACMTSSLCSW